VPLTVPAIQEHERRAAEKQESGARRQKAKAEAKQKYIDDKVAQQQDEDWAPKVGDLVEVPKLGGVARVQSVRGQKLSVTLGSIPVTVKLSDVLRV
jgi:hypothetical protein